MVEVLIFYLCSTLAAIAAIFGGVLWFKKKEVDLHLKFFFLGIIVSVVYFTVLLVLFFSTFNATSDQYFNTGSFRVLIGFVYVFILCLVRSLIFRGTLFAREKREQGMSLSFGFGVGPALLLGIYLLMMAVVILYNGIVHSPVEWNAEGYLLFADNTIIGMIFPMPAAHLYIMLAFIGYMAMVLANGWFYKQISQRVISPVIVVSFAIGLALLETGTILPIPFVDMGSYWGLSIIGTVAAILAITLVCFLPKEKKPMDYTKQFE